MTATASGAGLTSLLAFPKALRGGNARYNAILYEAMAAQGVTIHDYRRGLPFQARAQAFHLHWPDRVFGGLGRFHAAIGLQALAALRSYLRACRRSGRGVFWTVHNDHPHDFSKPAYAAAYVALETDLLALADGFIFLSQASLDRFVARHGADLAQRCAVIPHMSPDVAPQPGHDARPPELGGVDPGSYFLVPGQIRRYKRIGEAAGVYDGLRGPQDRLVVAGPPADRVYADELKQKYADRSDILILDRVLSEDEMDWCYRHARAVLALQASQGNSGVLYSALAHGARVLSRPGEVADEIGARVGPGWIVTVEDDLTPALADLACPPAAKPDLSWGAPSAIAAAHIAFMGQTLESLRSARRR